MPNFETTQDEQVPSMHAIKLVYPEKGSRASRRERVLLDRSDDVLNTTEVPDDAILVTSNAVIMRESAVLDPGEDFDGFEQALSR